MTSVSLIYFWIHTEFISKKKLIGKDFTDLSDSSNINYHNKTSININSNEKEV